MRWASAEHVGVLRRTVGVAKRKRRGSMGTMAFALVLLLEVLGTFQSGLTQPGFERYLVFAVGWILASGPTRCVTEALVATGVSGKRHWEAYHRLFSRGTWHPDKLGWWLFQRLQKRSTQRVLRLVIDDTLCPKKGLHVFGIGSHLDAVRSTKKRKSFCFGHCWLVLAILVEVPFSPRVWAIPILFRLYRNKKDAPEDYAKKTELAREMLQVVLGWIEGTKSSWQVAVALDQGYANSTVMKGMPAHVTFFGAMRTDAALTALPTNTQDKGPAQKRGQRLPTPAELAAGKKTAWRTVQAHLYGKTVTVQYKIITCQWFRVLGAAPLSVVVVRCSTGDLPYRAFFCTDPKRDVRTILEVYAARWGIEVFFREGKQLFGLADSPAWTENAVRRVMPMVGLLYSMLVVWFAEVHDSPVVQLPVRPWYGHKKGLCFADILRAARGTLQGFDVLAYAEETGTFHRPATATTKPLQLTFDWKG